MKLLIAALSLPLSVAINAEDAQSIKYPTASGSQIVIRDLGLIPGGTTSSGLAINDQPVIVGLANDSTFALQRPSGTQTPERSSASRTTLVLPALRSRST